MSELFKDIPEFVETHIGESLTARTDTLASFRELGPPDLCHVLKTSGSKAAPKELGSYHYLSGVEASSSASLAAYINSLQFHIEDPQAWFATKGSLWHVGGGTYCCFNAFSRVDMRVDVRIPGGVEGYVIDLRGERHPPTPQLWLETFLSALLRAINYADDSSYRLAGFRKLDPITTPEAERRFLEVAEQLFEQGWQLGSDPEIQVATITTNHLTNGIIKYFKDSGRLDVARRFFERVIAKAEKNGQPESMANIGEVRALVARCCIGMNAEIDAVKILHSAIRANPLSYPLLHAQTDFLLSKNRADWARAVAQQAVNAAPSEFVTWAKLTECHIALGDYESALLTLNSCPMFTFNERDLHRMPPPARTHLPVKKYIAESGILDEESSRDTEADVTLLRLPAPGLRGTFAKAYELLTVLVGKIGWDELLRRRSRVFVMEEEYRAHKRGETVDLGKAAEAAAAAARARKGRDDDSDTASTRGLRESSDPPTTAKSDIPTIRISTESARTPVNGTPDDGSSNGMPQEEREAAEVEKPAAAHAAAEDGVDATAAETGGVSPATTTDVNGTNGNGSSQANGEVQGDQAVSAFSNKRLCERWLDNLFLVLYEDLRVYTIWRAEISYFKTQHRSYRKTGTEWEILGELALRLHHKDEAKDAFQRCLETKFSAKALIKLLETYATEGDLQKSLNTAIKLTTYHHRWYMDSAYPSLVASWIYKLGLEHGHAKIQYTLLSMNLPVGVFEIMQGYLKYASTFNVEGSGF